MKSIALNVFDYTKNYLKSLNWIVLLGIAAFCIALAVINNIRVEDSKSVDWIGSQEILAKPDEVL
ncbi:hypothetical protein [Fibrobacter sp. UWB10]|uniref:hypothetical protein n=1 Tax=Fibrobacter sp. UWB10 TaxID=1896201 RepID=UPI0024B814C6|nr:hypothetical protein [Fibrobacter sp. UWB10]